MEKQLTCTDLALVAEAMRTIRQIGQGAGWFNVDVNFLSASIHGGDNVHVTVEGLKAVADATGQDVQFVGGRDSRNPWTGSVDVDGVKFFSLIGVDQLAVLGYTSPLVSVPLPERLPIRLPAPDPVTI